jgi:HAE1 family hydrophobic/amphiphilic exporter-1
VGPTLTWTLWDEGALYSSWRAQNSRAASAQALARLQRREATLGVRLAYFQLQLAREQLAVLADSLALADAQYEDLAKRERAGASSRLDALEAHQSALQRRREYLDQQASLGAAWSELAALTGDARAYDPARPGDSRSSFPPAGLPEPTMLVEVDALSVSTGALADAARREVDPAHPRLAAYESLADAARLSARAAEKGAWPKIQFTGSVAYLYPNGPVLESVWQKSAGLTASIPLFEFGRSRRDADDYRGQAASAEGRKADARDGLERDRAKSLERLAALQTQSPILDRSVAETDEIARLTYSAYKAGRSTFLEVQSANLGALEAKTARARADAQGLIQLATLASLVPENQP